MPVTGGIIGVSCLCIAAGVYTLLRGELPPPFRQGAGFTILNPPASAVRRWGIALLLFGAVLAALAWMSVSTRNAA